MPPRDRAGLLLVNLGTPDSPNTADVRRYLREFLSDPASHRHRCLPALAPPQPDHPAVPAAPDLPRRTRRSGPIAARPSCSTRAISRRRFRQRCGDGVVVDVAMRYGNPSIPEALGPLQGGGRRSHRRVPSLPAVQLGGDRLVDRDAWPSVASKPWNTPFLQIVPPFYDHRAFIDACVAVARPVFRGRAVGAGPLQLPRAPRAPLQEERRDGGALPEERDLLRPHRRGEPQLLPRPVLRDGAPPSPPGSGFPRSAASSASNPASDGRRGSAPTPTRSSSISRREGSSGR